MPWVRATSSRSRCGRREGARHALHRLSVQQSDEAMDGPAYMVLLIEWSSPQHANNRLVWAFGPLATAARLVCPSTGFD